MHYKIRLKVKPIYKRMDGWLKNTKGIKKWDDLPLNAQKYISFIKDFAVLKYLVFLQVQVEKILFLIRRSF